MLLAYNYTSLYENTITDAALGFAGLAIFGSFNKLYRLRYRKETTCIDVRTMLTVLIGDHRSFIISKHIIPSAKTNHKDKYHSTTIRMENGCSETNSRRR